MFSINIDQRPRARTRTYGSGEVARQLIASGDLSPRGNPNLTVKRFMWREYGYPYRHRMTAAQVRKVADGFRTA